MGQFNLQIDYRTAMLARVVQMAGIGFLWVRSTRRPMLS